MAKPNEVFCVDCRHYRDEGNSRWSRVEAKCTSPNSPRNLVTGEFIYGLCYDRRSSPYVQTSNEMMRQCGPDGFWFEPKFSGS